MSVWLQTHFNHYLENETFALLLFFVSLLISLSMKFLKEYMEDIYLLKLD